MTRKLAFTAVAFISQTAGLFLFITVSMLWLSVGIFGNSADSHVILGAALLSIVMSGAFTIMEVTALAFPEVGEALFTESMQARLVRWGIAEPAPHEERAAPA